MENNENENLPEDEIAPDEKTSAQPEQETRIPPSKSEKQPLSRARRFWRSSLIWLSIIAITFTAGVVTFNYLRYQPQQKELAQAYETTTDLQNQVNSLTAKLNTANDRLAVLEDAQTHLELMQVLVDVNNARLALADKDIPAAKAALEKTSQHLEDLAPRLSAADASLVTSLPQRLTLILSGLDNDVETAKVDLELLAGNLMDIATSLFGN